MNLWHDISSGEPEKINVIVEINKGSKNKYEIDKKTGLIALDRVAETTQDFPFDYGFIPQTFWHDNDPLDVVILTTHPLVPGLLARVRPVGVMNMIDDGHPDDKIIAVPTEDPRWEQVRDLGDINPHTIKEMEHFYSTYKKIKGRDVSIAGFHGHDEAVKIFKEGVELYRQKYSNK